MACAVMCSLLVYKPLARKRNPTWPVKVTGLPELVWGSLQLLYEVYSICLVQERDLTENSPDFRYVLPPQ